MTLVMLMLGQKALASPINLHQQADVLITYENTGKLYVIVDTLSVDYVVPIIEIETTIDFLSLKVATMKYATDLEKLKPLTLKSGDFTYTVFQTPLPLHLSSTVCSNFGLPPMSITDLPEYFRVPFSVVSLIFHFEILLSDGRLTCLTPTKVIQEPFCLDTLQNVTKSDHRFPTQQALKTYIMNNLTSTSLFLIQDQGTFRLSATPYGVSACLGEIPTNTSNSIKRLHDHFFSKLTEVFEHIFDIIETNAYRLTDTLLTIAAEEDSSFILTANISQINREIFNLLPTLLPAMTKPNYDQTHFDRFFAKYVNRSIDSEVDKLRASRTIIENLDDRKKSILYVSLVQFNLSVQKRLNTLCNVIRNVTSDGQVFPNTFLFASEQSSFSFRTYMQNILRISDDEILTNFFIIIQNQKNILLQNTASLLGLSYSPRHLTRAMLLTIQKEVPPKIDSILSIKNVKIKPKIGSYILEKKLTKSTQNSDTSNVYELTKLPSQSKPTRVKRSWGGFWGSTFALATQEEMNKIVIREMEMSHNEQVLGNSLMNVTITNAQIINSLKAVSGGVNKLISDEQTIFDQIDSIVTSEEQYLEGLNDLLNMIDQTTSLVSEYQLIQLQIQLLIHSVDKLKSLVTAMLTHTIDPSLIPTSIFESHLQDNLKTSMRLAKYQLKNSINGVVLNIQIPLLSNPYYMYTFNTIPFKLSDGWYFPVKPIDIAINSINEVIVTEEARNECIRVQDDIACNPKHVRIIKTAGLIQTKDKFVPKLKHNNLLCAVHILKNGSEPMACGIEIQSTLEYQMYVIKHNYLFLASPILDTLISQCTDKKVDSRQNIKIGLNKLSLIKNCHYETTQLVIYGVKSTSVAEKLTDFEEIDTVNDLSSMDLMLEKNIPAIGNLTVVREQLKKYNESISSNRKTVEELSKTLGLVEKIHQISEFDPGSLNFSQPMATSNVVTVIFWTLILLVLGLIIYGSYKKCPTKCTNCLVIPFIVLKHMCCVCVGVVQQAAKSTYVAAPQSEWETQQNNIRPTNERPIVRNAPADNPNVIHNYSFRETQFLQLNPLPLQWTIQAAAYEALSIQTAVAFSDTQTKRVKFDPISYTAMDMENNSLDYIPSPPASILDRYINMLKAMPSAATFTDNERIIRHKKFMFLTFNTESYTWFNTQTNSFITGIPNPAEFSTAKCY